MEYFLLCREFLKTGLFAIGGGLATVPFLTQMAENHPQWFSLAELMNMIAVSESTPGPIGINMATYVGYTVGGIEGALLATFSLILPAFVILMIITRALQKFRTNRLVNAVFLGLRPAVTGLIAAAGYSLIKLALFGSGTINYMAIGLFVILLVCKHIKKLNKLHPIAYIAISAALGVALSL